jgi:hypothetical protein
VKGAVRLGGASVMVNATWALVAALRAQNARNTGDRARFAFPEAPFQIALKAQAQMAVRRHTANAMAPITRALHAVPKERSALRPRKSTLFASPFAPLQFDGNASASSLHGNCSDYAVQLSCRA